MAIFSTFLLGSTTSLMGRFRKNIKNSIPRLFCCLLYTSEISHFSIKMTIPNSRMKLKLIVEIKNQNKTFKHLFYKFSFKYKA